MKNTPNTYNISITANTITVFLTMPLETANNFVSSVVGRLADILFYLFYIRTLAVWNIVL